MATKEQFQELARLFTEDQEFQDRFMGDPAGAASSVGIELSSEDINNTKQAIAEAEKTGSREAKSILGWMGLLF